MRDDEDEEELDDVSARKKSQRPSSSSSSSGPMELRSKAKVKFTEMIGGNRSRWLVPTEKLIAHASMKGESRLSPFFSLSSDPFSLLRSSLTSHHLQASSLFGVETRSSTSL